jgi:hypothetical protein
MKQQVSILLLKNTYKNMRKITLTVSALATALLFSCGGSETKETKSSETQDAQMMQAMPAAKVKGGIGPIPVPNDTMHIFPVTDAIEYIENFTNSNGTIQQYSFTFNTAELLAYLEGTHSSIMNLMLGQDKHQFMTRNDTCFVLTQGASANVPEHLEAEVATIDTFLVEAMDTARAQQMIAAYQNGQYQKKNNGWLYNANDMIGFIRAGINAQGGMQYTQFILAVRDGKIDLIATGSQDGVHHMYFGYNDKCCVMENFNPCPTCLTVSGGSTLDKSHCNY